MPPRRRRSKSTKRAPKDQPSGSTKTPKQEGSVLDKVFGDKPPWVSSTPQTRVNQRTVQEEHQEMDQALPLPPPAPVVPPPSSQAADKPVALTDDEVKQLGHLRALKGMNMPLSEQLVAIYEELERKEQLDQPAQISHSQLNRFNKLNTQISAVGAKVRQLDEEWTQFLQNIVERTQNHALQYQQCRKELIVSLKTKQQELRQLKSSISQASMTMVAQKEVLELPEDQSELQASMEVLQRLAYHANLQQVQFVEDDPSDDDEPELMETQPVPAEDEKSSVQTKLTPHTRYKGQQSPTKVLSTHVKTKENKKKDHKEAKGSKEDQEDEEF